MLNLILEDFRFMQVGDSEAHSDKNEKIADFKCGGIFKVLCKKGLYIGITCVRKSFYDFTIHAKSDLN